MHIEARLGELDSAPRRAGSTRRARATTRSPSISGCSCAARSMSSTPGLPGCSWRSPARRRCPRGKRHAGLHPPASGPTGDLRPSLSLAYVEMVGRATAVGFRDARARMNECPLGAAALAGTSFAIDRTRTASELGFPGADAQLARCSFRSATCPRNPRGIDHRRHPPVASRRGDRPVVVRPVPVVGPFRTRSPPALVDHAAEAQSPTPPSWCAPRPAASPALWCRCSSS